MENLPLFKYSSFLHKNDFILKIWSSAFILKTFVEPIVQKIKLFLHVSILPKKYFD